MTKGRRGRACSAHRSKVYGDLIAMGALTAGAPWSASTRHMAYILWPRGDAWGGGLGDAWLAIRRAHGYSARAASELVDALHKQAAQGEWAASSAHRRPGKRHKDRQVQLCVDVRPLQVSQAAYEAPP